MTFDFFFFNIYIIFDRMRRKRTHVNPTVISLDQISFSTDIYGRKWTKKRIVWKNRKATHNGGVKVYYLQSFFLPLPLSLFFSIIVRRLYSTNRLRKERKKKKKINLEHSFAMPSEFFFVVFSSLSLDTKAQRIINKVIMDSHFLQ